MNKKKNTKNATNNGASKTKRQYIFEVLPAEEDLSRYAIPYIPEKFSKEEVSYLKPFFSNIEKPVFVAQHLPEEVIGALSSRYSRATQSLRRLFLKEYIGPIIHPELQKNWIELTEKERKEAIHTRDLFLHVIERLNKGESVESVVNIQRGRKFFDTWLAQYGDDSIAELGGIHLCIEGASNIAVKEMQDKRVGISPLEKSTRYVQFWEKRPDGNYQYIIPGELKGTKMEDEYKKAMDLLFETYSKMAEPYLNYIKQLYPKGDDETDRSFESSRGAKRFDDARDLLPFATQTSFAMFGNGRAFEDLINRLMLHPIGELRWWGQMICEELESVVPSFVRRPKTLRGAQAQGYRKNLQLLRQELTKEVLYGKKQSKIAHWVRLISFTPEAEIEVLSTFLFSGQQPLSLSDVRKAVKKLGIRKRKELLARILDERRFNKVDIVRQEVRFRKVPRSFENAHYLFEIWARGGDYRDLQRHRQLTQERQLFTTQWGYDLEQEVIKSEFIKDFRKAFTAVEKIYKKLEKFSPSIAQYAVPFGYLQHWYANMTAREVYWIVELRTGPQGRPHYRQVCQQIAKFAMEATPDIFQNLMTDWSDYSLARRESEKKIDTKLRTIEKKK
jgi:thymidylate synthase ThyX